MGVRNSDHCQIFRLASLQEEKKFIIRVCYDILFGLFRRSTSLIIFDGFLICTYLYRWYILVIYQFVATDRPFQKYTKVYIWINKKLASIVWVKAWPSIDFSSLGWHVFRFANRCSSLGQIKENNLSLTIIGQDLGESWKTESSEFITDLLNQSWFKGKAWYFFPIWLWLKANIWQKSFASCASVRYSYRFWIKKNFFHGNGLFLAGFKFYFKTISFPCVSKISVCFVKFVKV